MIPSHQRFRDLVDPLLEEMGRTVWRIVRNEEEASDAVQEAILKIWKNLDRVLTHPNSRALILKVCIDCGYDSLRRSIRANNHHFQLDDFESLQGNEALPSERLLEMEEEREVLKAISDLPKDDAIPLVMRHINESTYAEISEVLGCSETAARKQISRARARLSKHLSHLLPITSKEKR